MMTGKTYLDGIDIYTTFGIYVTEGGYNGLATYPPLKKPEINDWQEYNGIEVDLTAPELDTREFQINF